MIEIRRLTYKIIENKIKQLSTNSNIKLLEFSKNTTPIFYNIVILSNKILDKRNTKYKYIKINTNSQKIYDYLIQNQDKYNNVVVIELPYNQYEDNKIDFNLIMEEIKQVIL
jgi:phosphopantetheine adenylyltransferase